MKFKKIVNGLSITSLAMMSVTGSSSSWITFQKSIEEKMELAGHNNHNHNNNHNVNYAYNNSCGRWGNSGMMA